MGFENAGIENRALVKRRTREFLARDGSSDGRFGI